MILANKEDGNSKHGLVLTSMSQTLKLSSIMKSNPKTSKEFSLCDGSIFPNTDLIQSVANDYK